MDERFFDLDNIMSRLEVEAEMKEWASIYIAGDTHIHPYIAKFLSDHIKQNAFKCIVEIGTHHGVLTRFLAINNVDTQFYAVDEINDTVNANLSDLTNVTLVSNYEEIGILDPDLLILNYGLSSPSREAIAHSWSSFVKHAGKQVIITGHESEKMEEKIDRWVESTGCLKKLWGKMDCAIYELMRG
jgi:hypothetical protein